MTHYPNNEKHGCDQWADTSRVNSTAYKLGHERIFGPRPGEVPEAEIAAVTNEKHGVFVCNRCDFETPNLDDLAAHQLNKGH